MTLHSLQNNPVCSFLSFISTEWELGKTEKREQCGAERKGMETVGRVVSVTVEADRIPGPAGGLSSKITDPTVIILEAWGWGLRVLARVRQTYVYPGCLDSTLVWLVPKAEILLTPCLECGHSGSLLGFLKHWELL